MWTLFCPVIADRGTHLLSFSLMAREDGTANDDGAAESARRQRRLDYISGRLDEEAQLRSERQGKDRPAAQHEDRPATFEAWAASWLVLSSEPEVLAAAPRVQNPVVAVVHPSYPGWEFRLTFSPKSGAMVGFETLAWQGRDGMHAPSLTARFLRGLPVGEIESVARRQQADLADSMWAEGISGSLIERHAQAFDKEPRPGRRGRADRSYAEVAAIYVEACQSGSRSPVVDVAESLSYSTKRVRNLLTAARRKGLLTAAPAGRHGGQLTEAALTLLRKD